ncbi:MAG: hypothetical protein R6U91_07295 [Bacillota bacterium]
MNRLYGLLKENGPLTGKELVEKSGLEVFDAWRNCCKAEGIVTQIVGNRYLRLDQKVAGYARLSPSIMREFLNYTVVGLDKDIETVAKEADKLTDEITAISKKKFDLARDTIYRLLEEHPGKNAVVEKTVFIIAGDVVYNMAHKEPRPEASTGELVKGSDLDVIVVSGNLPKQELNKLDQLIYREKYNLLVSPVLKEELDYVVKDVNIVKSQVQFNDFKAMVASKILYEGVYLYGSYDLYLLIKKLVTDYGVNEKLNSLQEKAWEDRLEAERTLLSAPGSAGEEELMTLFYTTEEKEEIF